MKKIIYFFKNYWYYYKGFAIVAAFILFAVGFTVYERVTYVKPDMIIDCISDSLYLSLDNIEKICEDIEKSGALSDINGDEKIKTSLSTYSAGQSDTTVGTDGGSAYEIMEIKMAIGNSALIIADKKVLERYEKYNIYQDISDIAQKLGISEEDLYYSSEGAPVGVRLDNRDVFKKYGISSEDVFLAIRVQMDSVDEEMIEQAPNVAEYILK